jgi:hypothetical protein
MVTLSLGITPSLLFNKGKQDTCWNYPATTLSFYSGRIAPEWWPQSDRNAGRIPVGTVVAFPPEWWPDSSGIGKPLAKVLQVLGEEAGGFTFQDIWMGDKAETSGESTLPEILEEIRNNQIKNKHVYRVSVK